MKKSLQEHLYCHEQYLTAYETSTEIEVDRYVEEILHIYNTLRHQYIFYSQRGTVELFNHPELDEVINSSVQWCRNRSGYSGFGRYAFQPYIITHSPYFKVL